MTNMMGVKLPGLKLSAGNEVGWLELGHCRRSPASA